MLCVDVGTSVVQRVRRRSNARLKPRPCRAATRRGQSGVSAFASRLKKSLPAAALKNRSTSFDGEAVLLGVDGVSDSDGLQSGKHDDEVQLYAFDALVADGEDLRKLPLSMRKANLARLPARRPDGIFVAPFEQVWMISVGLVVVAAILG